ncbi:MAG: 23S rRNA (guanosine(2251)-2'-O)-methyltransferase RlmB [Desulfarculales bacterium]|jgi:23S rRNA (guanosine2251-2'-O)-methyltransferase|nr:23S rRNA (guanosine(2251)-2'-O)-methyltransferase RlmB [Desulfarculales bacterium]
MAGLIMKGEGKLMKEERQIIVGRHAVSAVLSSRPEMIDEFLVASDENVLMTQQLLDTALKRGVTVRRVPKSYLTSLAGLAVHQGVAVCLIAGGSYAPLEEIISAAKAAGNSALVLMADHIQDPHNLGALIRSAAAAGAQGIIIAKDRACQLTPAVAKAAAGTLNMIPVCRVTNLAHTLEQLRDEAGLWSLAAVPGQERPPWEQDLNRPLALIIGGEHQGVSRLLLELCDMKASLPLSPQVESLNASVAAGVMLFEIIRQRAGVPEHKPAACIVDL